ncbi:hypothetical protein [Halomonas marinisediminis]|uniref:Uncharacterized protein n=1 Tax=Halomonas marinisediminis TaxID=2546095 RepID=A0ABY2DCX3_9GAMM|nr:hypothetical protein [Halomonas marinisediminis]TDB05118.1 hypothetical protein E0702_02700 [Halomonas marinisediminis]
MLTQQGDMLCRTLMSDFGYHAEQEMVAMDTPDFSAWTPARLNALEVQISHWLFTKDPMHTCCVENDAFDEYDAVAMSLVEQLANGVDPHAALQEVLTTSFGDELVNRVPLRRLAFSLCELLAAEASRRGEGA